jgi:hypothetical protein
MSKCAKYTNDECLGGQIGCVYHGGYCISGVCALLNTDLNDDECRSNKKCKRLISVKDDSAEMAICWENNCSSFSSGDCPSVGCVVGVIGGVSKCLFDECNVYGSSQCNNNGKCIYTFDEGCHMGVCKSIGTDLKSCRMNVKCKVVKGTCEEGCSDSTCDSL